MRSVKDIDFTRTFGDVPPSFSDAVQEALCRTQKEEQPVKRITFRIVAIAAVLVMLATAGIATAISQTIAFFDKSYGDLYHDQMMSGEIDTQSKSIDLDGMTVQLHDVVIVANTLPDTGEATQDFYATGKVTPSEGTNAVLMASDDYQVTDPAGYTLYHGDLYGNARPAEGEEAPSYADLARAKGLDRIRMVHCVANGLLDENGELISQSVGYEVLPNLDGSVDFSVELPGEVPIPQRESYQLSLYIGIQDLDLEGNPIGERVSTDWVVTVTPDKGD